MIIFPGEYVAFKAIYFERIIFADAIANLFFSFYTL